MSDKKYPKADRFLRMRTGTTPSGKKRPVKISHSINGKWSSDTTIIAFPNETEENLRLTWPYMKEGTVSIDLTKDAVTQLVKQWNEAYPGDQIR